MDIKQIEYVLKVAELGSFSKAAKSLFISQPSLSQSIKKLELELGVSLFSRNAKSVSLTNEGTLFAQMGKRVLEERRVFLQDINNMSSTICGELSIGVPRTRGNVILPRIIPEYMKRYPKVSLIIEEAPAQTLEEMVNNGDIDLCFINEPVSSAQIEKTALFKDRALIIASKNSGLDAYATYKSPHDAYPTISIKHLTDKEFISLKPSEKFHSVTERIFDSTGVSVKTLLKCRNMTTILKLVSAKIGYSIMYDSIVSALDTGNQVSRYYIDEWPYESSVIIGRRKNRPLSNCCKAFISVSCQLFS